MKKNNKGFSLVELIVVVLIMAIIAVALAPQVMKWVENSRKSTDCSNYDAVVEAVNLALANEDVMKKLGVDTTAQVQLEWKVVSSGDSWSITANDATKTALDSAISGILGSTWKSSMAVKRTTDLGNASSTGWLIKINKNGTVERGTGADAPSSNIS